MSKNKIAVVAAMLVGSVAGATIPSISAQAFASAPEAPRYLQFCEHFGGDNATGDMDEAVRRYGVHGFRISSHAFDQSHGILACFSRDAPSR